MVLEEVDASSLPLLQGFGSSQQPCSQKQCSSPLCPEGAQNSLKEVARKYRGLFFFSGELSKALVLHRRS